MRFKSNVLTTVLSLVISAGLAGTVDAELIGHWKLDDNAANTTVTDSSGNTRDGTFNTNTEDRSVTGKVGNSLDFNGTSDYVDLDSYADPLGNNVSDFTLSAWIQHDGGNAQMLFTWSDGGMANHIQMLLNLKEVHFYMADNDSTACNFGTDRLTWTADTWYHVAFINDSTNGKKIIRSNDSVSATHANTLGPGDLTGDITTVEIGSLNAPDYYFDGRIDDVQLYDWALSDDQVQWLYDNPGMVIPEPSSIFLLVSGLLVWLLVRFRRKKNV